MSKTTALRTELQRLLKTLATYVYYEEADKANYPYVVFEHNELTFNDGKIGIQLEVNVCDYGSDSSVAEALADNVQAALSKYFFINTEIQFTVYKGLRQIIREEDKQIIRRRLLFEIQLHEVKGE